MGFGGRHWMTVGLFTIFFAVSEILVDEDATWLPCNQLLSFDVRCLHELWAGSKVGNFQRGFLPTNWSERPKDGTKLINAAGEIVEDNMWQGTENMTTCLILQDSEARTNIRQIFSSLLKLSHSICLPIHERRVRHLYLKDLSLTLVGSMFFSDEVLPSKICKKKQLESSISWVLKISQHSARPETVSGHGNSHGTAEYLRSTSGWCCLMAAEEEVELPPNAFAHTETVAGRKQFLPPQKMGGWKLRLRIFFGGF